MLRPVAALFDMDGLLLDTERVGMAVFQDLLARYGVPRATAEALYLNVLGTSFANTHAVVAQAVPGVDITAFDKDWTDGVEAAMADAVPLRPTVRETLAKLDAQQVPMAVVTTTRTKRAKQHLEHAGLLHHFVDVIGFDRVSAPKPDPAPYLTGAKLHRLEASHCAAFEDSDTGTTSAVRAGCQTWQIPDLRASDKPLLELGQNQATTLEEAVQASGLLG